MSKIEKLCNAYEKFGQAIATIPDDESKALSRMCVGVREFVSGAREGTPKPTPSQVAAGLEQGWRETPQSIQRVAQEWRATVATAWHDATLLAYPEFLTTEQQRLQKVLERGKIRTEAEFYRIRHEVDLLEGRPGAHDELQRMYSLIDIYEKR